MIWCVRNPRSRRTRGVLGVLGFEARRWEYRRSIAAAVARATRYALPCRASKTRCVLLPRPRRKHDGQAYHAPPRAWWRWRKRPINETPGKMRHTRSGSGPPGAKRVQTSYTPFSCFLQHSLYPFSLPSLHTMVSLSRPPDGLFDVVKNAIVHHADERQTDKEEHPSTPPLAQPPVVCLHFCLARAHH